MVASAPFVHPMPEGTHQFARDGERAVVLIDADVLYALARRAKLYDQDRLWDWERNASEGPQRDDKIAEHTAHLDQSADFCLWLHDVLNP